MKVLDELRDFIMTGQSLAEQGECLMPNITDVLNEIERLNQPNRCKQCKDIIDEGLRFCTGECKESYFN